MIITAQLVQSRLQEHLQHPDITVLDESAQHAGHSGSSGALSGTHFRVRIPASAFKAKSRVERHREIYAPLQDLMNQGLHALAIEIIP
jgi:BolA family transcriptional regulator, general stress-responsive regulator